ncbi:type II CAAX endopeptidase family protein [Paraglaciecola sp. 25GB23A]|uniref:CPBP family intramembrane glutamic endopeptidase n=1 Tax=Paraglaciecola sp. 25GB23A TaxID=3156068 RepID=UPI0032AEF8D7
MKNIFYNDDKKVRNGWWILIFIALVAATRPIYKPIKEGLSHLGFTEQMLEPVSFLLLLLVTWICIKIRKESLSDVGFGFSPRWFKHFFGGTIAGITMMLATVALVYLVGGVSFELDPQRSLQVLSYGFYLFLLGSLFEEILHRGFVFQRLIDGIGIWGAQLLIAFLFTFGHWGNPGMEGSTQIFSSIDLFLGSIILGLAYIKTHSLALPIGIHLGWNWMQGNVLGFGVTGHEQAGWFKPVFQGMQEWVSGGEFGPEASIFSVVVSIAGLVILLRWKGTVKRKQNTQETIAEATATS